MKYFPTGENNNDETRSKAITNISYEMFNTTIDSTKLTDEKSLSKNGAESKEFSITTGKCILI